MSLPSNYRCKTIRLTNNQNNTYTHIFNETNIFGEPILYDPKRHQLNKHTGRYYTGSLCLGQIDIRSSPPRKGISKPAEDSSKLEALTEEPSRLRTKKRSSTEPPPVTEIVSKSKEEDQQTLPNTEVLEFYQDILSELRAMRRVHRGIYDCIRHLPGASDQNSDIHDLEERVQRNDEFSRLDWKTLISDPEELETEVKHRLDLASGDQYKIRKVNSWRTRAIEHGNTFEAKLMGSVEVPPPEKSEPEVRLL